MGLISTDSSAARRQAFRAGLRHLAQMGRVPMGLQVHPNPQPVYVASVKKVQGDNRLPTAAKLVSWRFFAGDVSGDVVVGDVTDAMPPKLISLRHGSSAKKALQSKLALEALSDVQAEDFEPRLLRIPGALVEAHWLKPRSENNGLVVPCRGVFGSTCKPGMTHATDDFLKGLRAVTA